MYRDNYDSNDIILVIILENNNEKRIYEITYNNVTGVFIAVFASIKGI